MYFATNPFVMLSQVWLVVRLVNVNPITYVPGAGVRFTEALLTLPVE
jgi:hypothetical protein